MDSRDSSNSRDSRERRERREVPKKQGGPLLCEPAKKFGESWGSLRVPCQKEEEGQEGTKWGEGCSGW